MKSFLAVVVLIAILTGIFLLVRAFHFILDIISRRRPSSARFIKSFGDIFPFVVLLLIMAAIAIPDFLKMGPKKDSEAKTNLGAIFTTQKLYHQEHGVYAGGPHAFAVLNWEPVGQNMYAYACGDDYLPNTKGDRATNVVPPWPDGLRPASSKTGFTCFAVGNIDNDTALDYWSINDAKELTNEPSDL